MDRTIVENLDKYQENKSVHAVARAVGRKYELDAMILAWNVCRYGKLIAEMGVELGEWFDEDKAIDLLRNNAGFYRAVKMCHVAMMRANAGVAT